MALRGLTRRIRESWRKLSRLDARPGQIAAGFCIGVAAGLLPLNPSPIATATVAAWLLRRNLIAAAAGAATAVLYLPVLPLIWLAEYRLGKLILPVRHPLALERAQLWDVLQQGWDVYAAMLLGCTVIAAPAMLLSYWGVKRLAQRWASRRNAQRSSE